MSAKAAIFMAPGFEEMELTITVDILRRAGIEVQIVTLDPDLTPVRGSRNIHIVPDVTIGSLQCDSLDIAILPGGLEGTQNLGQCQPLLTLLQTLHGDGKKIAAICAAPAILAKIGMLNGRRATSHPAAAEYMHGASYSEDRVVIDGNFITSRAAGTTFEFAFTIITQLLGKAAADKVNEGVLARL